jgi:cytosine deaminase
MNILIKNSYIYSEFDSNKKTEKLLKDISIKNGKIDQILDTGNFNEGDFSKVIDAKGNLVTPPFIDPHIHLDKILINEVVRENVTGTLKEAIEIIWEKKKNYDLEDIRERAGRIIREAISHGTLYMRTHVDIDTIGGLKPLEGVLLAKEDYKDIFHLEIVAFPQEGIIKDPGCEELMYKAMEMGADIVGGMPASENCPEDSLKHVQIVFDIAEKFNCPIDMHVDETDDPFFRTLEMTADEIVSRNFQPSVTAGHTCALASYDKKYAEYVMDKVKKTGINMITNPVTNLMLQGRFDDYPKRRGLTRVKELVNLGVNVAFGQDCIKDPFYPLGSADMLEVGNILCHAAHMSLPHEILEVFDMPLFKSSKLLGLDNYGIKEGGAADLVIIDTDNPIEALRLNSDRLFVIKDGVVLASTKTDKKMYL